MKSPLLRRLALEAARKYPGDDAKARAWLRRYLKSHPEAEQTVMQEEVQRAVLAEFIRREGGPGPARITGPGAGPLTVANKLKLRRAD